MPLEQAQQRRGASRGPGPLSRELLEAPPLQEAEGAGVMQEKDLGPRDEVGKIGVVYGQRDQRSKVVSPLLAYYLDILYLILYLHCSIINFYS
jgi:hypothetical protein